jgi:hypothetical protein
MFSHGSSRLLFDGYGERGHTQRNYFCANWRFGPFVASKASTGLRPLMLPIIFRKIEFFHDAMSEKLVLVFASARLTRRSIHGPR